MTMRAPSAVRDLWKVVIAWGALTLILGILVLAKPGTSFVVTGALLGAYLVMSGIVEMVLTFVLDVSASSRIPLFISGALSLSLGVLAFRHLGYASAVLLLAIWIGVAFIFQGVSEIALAAEHPSLPDRGWYIFVGVHQRDRGHCDARMAVHFPSRGYDRRGSLACGPRDQRDLLGLAGA